MAYFMYVVACADGSWYTGSTPDVARRVAAHNAGRGAKYTQARLPVRLVACARFATKHEAMSAEWHFKQLDRRAKERLVEKATARESGRDRAPAIPAARAPAPAAREPACAPGLAPAREPAREPACSPGCCSPGSACVFAGLLARELGLAPGDPSDPADPLGSASPSGPADPAGLASP